MTRPELPEHPQGHEPPALRQAAGDLAVAAGTTIGSLLAVGVLVVALTPPTYPPHRAVLDVGPAVLGVCLLVTVVTHLAVTRRHHRRLRAQARAQAQEQARLRSSADGARRDERARIGAHLHDSVVQDLAGVAFDLQAAAGAGDGLVDDVRETLLEAADVCRSSITALRSLLVGLAPEQPPSVDLARALPELAGDLNDRGVKVSVHVTPPSWAHDDHELPALLYRAAQEGVRNVARHAAATRATILLTTREGLATLSVEDDGHGITPADLHRQRAAGHVGLTLLADRIRARRGDLTIASEPGRGTRLVVSLPVGTAQPPSVSAPS